MSAAERNETTKERILRVSTELFARGGYAATGVAEIAEACQLGKGALYYHIGSKEDLLYRICMNHVEDALARSTEIVDRDVSAEEKLRELSRLQMHIISDHLQEITIFFREGYALTGERFAKVESIRAKWEKVWADVLAQGVEEGRFRSSDSVTVKGVLGMFNYCWVWFDPAGALLPEDVADQLLDVILNGQLQPHSTNVAV